MRKSVPILAGLACVVLLSGCGKRGYDRARPDEFAVARQAPLVIPPDFALVPPQPGAARPQDNQATAQTLCSAATRHAAPRRMASSTRPAAMRRMPASVPRSVTRRPTSSTRARRRATSSPPPKATARTRARRRPRSNASPESGTRCPTVDRIDGRVSRLKGGRSRPRRPTSDHSAMERDGLQISPSWQAQRSHPEPDQDALDRRATFAMTAQVRPDVTPPWRGTTSHCAV